MKEDSEVHPHELIAALIDGIVTPAEREAVQSHLKACKPCRFLLEDLQRLSAASASEAVPPPPADLAARIRWRLQTLEAAREQAPPRAARVRWLAPFPLSAAAGLVIAFVVLWALRDQVVPEREEAGGVPEAGPPAMVPAAEPPPEPEAPKPEEEAPAPAASPAQPPQAAAGPVETPPAPASLGKPVASKKETREAAAEPAGEESRVQDPQSFAASVEDARVASARQAATVGEERKVFDPATGVTAAAPSPRSGRWMSLELQNMRIEVDEAGALSVDADRYSCAVQLQPGEVAQIFRLASGPGLSALGDLAMAPEGLDPELAHRGRRVLTRTGVRGEGYQAVEYLDLPERPAPATLREIEALMLQLVRSGARERLEKACGPLKIP